MLKKKIDYGRDFVREHLEIFQCPTCQQAFVEIRGNSMVCQNNHQFDLSKKGTIHFPNHHMTSDYDKEMLLSRRKMIQRGIYDTLIQKLVKHIQSFSKVDYVVDMGCGEGSFVQKLKPALNESTFLGFDLSKEGVQLASDFSEDSFFFIGDVTQMPFKNQSVDCLLNIFSPSHYEEMTRVLKPRGYLIKVIPEANYLTEMRQCFYHDKPEKQSYSNENVYEKFKQDIQLVKEERVTYKFKIHKDDYQDVLKMSPIHWGASAEANEYAKKNPFNELTIDVKILIGKS